jgi:hypothetical protein
MDLKDGKLNHKTDELRILFDAFANFEVHSKMQSSAKSDSSDNLETLQHIYEAIMSDLILFVRISVNKEFVQQISEAIEFEQKYKIYLENQFHKNTLFLQGMKHKFRHATQHQMECFGKACMIIKF